VRGASGTISGLEKKVLETLFRLCHGVTMHDTPRKPLREAVAGIVSMIIEMMLGLIRARGLRGLLELPTHLRLALELHRMGEAFAALFAAFKAGTLPPVPTAPEPDSWPAPHAASARPAAEPRRAVRARAPVRAARPRRAPAPIAWIPRAFRRMPVAIAPPCALPAPLAVVRATPLRKNPDLAALAWHVQIVTIS
jgi:hypothetical protein